MIIVNHELIRASAGTGKTHQLVCRYLRLLALGVEPERIAAMTFTRKAAGEFFQRILRGLANVAEDPTSAPDDAQELRTLERPKVIALLRGMIQRMDRLRLGTIDSFFAAMVQSLPFELGLSGAASLMSEEEQQDAQDQALDALLREPRGREAEMRELVEAWKRSNFGKDDNQPVGRLEKWLEDMHQWLMACPQTERWGGAGAIWADKQSPISHAGDDIEKAVSRLEGMIDPGWWKAKDAAERWESFFSAARGQQPGAKLEKGNPITYMLEPARVSEPKDKGHSNLRLGGTVWMMNKSKATLDMKVGSALADVIDIIVGRELVVRSERTKGRHALVSRFEKLYQQLVRSQGRLVFSDLAWLLTGRLVDGQVSKERWEELQRDLEYRLDARYDHWLLDEFQDTSVRQWAVLGNLADEILQDAGGERRFFAVGDLKQSIYLWREAEPELFRHVQEKCEALGVKRRSLAKSYRSGKAVLDTVNAVFGDKDALCELAPGIERWWSFEDHEPAGGAAALTGHAAYLTVPEGDDANAAQDGLIVSLIRNIQPVERGLSCAVLVRKNDRAVAIAASLRAALHVEVVCESETAIALDNPAVPALLSVLQCAAHPGDTIARGHVRMTPLGEWLEKEHMGGEKLAFEVRRELAGGGFFGVLTLWTQRLREVCGEFDAFTAQRLAQFTELAAECDAAGSRDLDAFLTAARSHKLREESADRAVQVMTIHKSKGLEFDVVIFADLHKSGGPGGGGDTLLVERGDLGQVEWLLDAPPSVIAAHDAQVRAARATCDAREAFEDVCNLYVAMTRAKRSLYLTAVVEDDKSPAKNAAASLFESRLRGGEGGEWVLGESSVKVRYETGDREWFTASALKPRATVPAAPARMAGDLGRRLRKVSTMVTRLAPSGEETFVMKGADLLSENRLAGRELGTLVHALLAEVPWLEGNLSDERGWMQAWKGRGLTEHPVFVRAREHAERVLRSAEARPFFTRSGTNSDVWIERRFDLLDGREWVTGALDRVVLERNEDGHFLSATIVDFKTDDVADDEAMQKKAKGYRPQMQRYAEAVQRLTGLNRESVKCVLVFVTKARVVPV